MTNPYSPARNEPGPEVRLVAMSRPMTGETAAGPVELAAEAGRLADGAPEGDTTAYVHALVENRRLDALEHAHATIGIDGISRAGAREVLAHRALVVSEEAVAPPSGEAPAPAVEPGEGTVARIAARSTADSRLTSEDLFDALLEELSGEPDPAARARAWRTASGLLSGAEPIRVIATGSMVAWRAFIARHGRADASPELRDVAVAVTRLMREAAPAIFDDFEIEGRPGGPVTVTAPQPPAGGAAW
ncbi:FAD-dependent thymidylate synthase [Corynebacterium otitidis]